tara:strand:- start:115 stop:1038 length:924 start_codon:yes stop_codon:yes gene_type:complete
MIVAKCPLRVSLAGGSTDLQDFIDQNGYGAVVSFPSTLYAYISLHENNRGKYIIDYTKREEVQNPVDIKNNVAREVLREYPMPPVTITFNTDAHSSGSGLASSSAFLIALIKAITTFKGIKISNFEICKQALQIERRFNPLTGHQDPYGCGLSSLKMMKFHKNKDPTITYLEQKLFDRFNMFLLYTGIKKNSTSVLKKTIKTDRRELLQVVETMSDTILKKDLHNFIKSVKIGWEHKKRTSPHVLEDPDLQALDKILEQHKDVLAHRLCGAGNRGYFLVFTDKSVHSTPHPGIKIDICQDGTTAIRI